MDNKIELEHALTFLYYFAGTIKSTLDKPWASYRVQIGAVGHEVTPLSSLNPEANVVIKDGPGVDTVEPDDDPWIAGVLLSIYRLLRASNAAYKVSLMEKIIKQLKALSPKSLEVPDVFDHYGGWQSNKSYNKLVAAYDMYFNRFPEHDYSALRVCTTGTRHRDCAGILSYGYLSDVLGFTSAVTILEWIFLDQIGNDVDRMMLSQDELSDPYSYFPYQVDLGIVTKSPYSATINSCFYEWVHIIGALLRIERSRNARHISEKQGSEIFAKAACVAYVFDTKFKFEQVYNKDGKEFKLKFAKEEEEEGDDDKDAEKLITSRDPEDWLTYMNVHDGELPTVVKKFIQKVGKSISDPRPGNMDAYIASKAATI